MKIGIVGAPGSGKSKFAKLLAKQYENHKVIDNYVSRLSRANGLAYSYHATYIENIQIIMKRRELELAAGDNQITVGTVIDSNSYAFIYTDLLVHAQRRLMASQYDYVETMMRSFGMLFLETWDYDYAFYLPSFDDEHRKLDEVIRTTIEAYFAPVIQLLGDSSINDKAKLATETIARLEADPVAAAV